MEFHGGHRGAGAASRVERGIVLVDIEPDKVTRGVFGMRCPLVASLCAERVEERLAVLPRRRRDGGDPRIIGGVSPGRMSSSSVFSLEDAPPERRRLRAVALDREHDERARAERLVDAR
eukprot:CAMPEP_0185711458 /NCGR_PEP_ID=MMETSP1164-20130828/32898_1 /TAXON_ID=1104430 /ORGANISM="Chrysoreinhardia sp, Strain CCMP2950" /LENGTH=118 /DNA_ID=CAMNT_0028379001 /DNA_START=287 /DNA_END=639 /DNA_ORIENTATION=-